ncbi:hypothetical protein [uncultured Adlercreutzia sp.]|uniref:hypothetical protein n=1 Tax=uncultured Adlercreutzia sp. TaxID=875803 RepID=UPI00272E5435|nr:hypothetical protein [uncultured Adlercreutzia sp.]
MIYVEDQLVKVNGVVLPGLVKSIEVKESAQIDEQEVEGSAAKPKQAVGYEDAKITVELILDDTPSRTKYEALAAVRAIFRKPGQTVPQPIPIVSEDTAKHGIDKVLFKGFSHKAEAKKEQITVSLEFWEYIPQTIKASKAGSSSSKSSGSSSGGTSSSGLSADYTNYLETSRGSSPVARDTMSGVASAAVGMVAKMLPE